MTLLTVIFVLGPMYEDGNGWYIMLCTGSMLYHHLLNPLAAILSFTVLWCIAILLMNYFYAWLLWKLNGGKKEKA